MRLLHPLSEERELKLELVLEKVQSWKLGREREKVKDEPKREGKLNLR